MSTTNDRVIAITTRRRPMFRPAIVKQSAPPQPVRRGSYADHRLQFPEMYAPPTPTADALLTCLIVILDHPDSLATITLVAETRGCGIGTAALELARQMARAGIGV